ncbi:MAG: hypothetical protein RXS42_09005 [Nitrososphaeria archaeon]
MNSDSATEAPAAPAAGAEAPSGGRIQKVKLVRGRYFPVPWGNPKVGTPWIAEITGLDPRYGFARRFIRAIVKDSHNTTYLVDVSELKVGHYYEERCPCSWRHPDDRNYYVVRSIDLEKGEVVIEYLEKSDIIFALHEHDPVIGGDDAPIWSGGHSVP